MSAKRPLTDEELFQLMEEGLSDIEYLSDEAEDDGWGEQANELDDVQEQLEEPELLQADVDQQEDEASTEASEAPELVHEQEEAEEEEPQPGPPKQSKTKRINDFMENNDLTKKQDIQWRKNIRYLTPDINWHEEANAEVIELESPYCFFEQYFTHDLYEQMATYTNLYATKNENSFSSTSVEEMKTFVGIHILMGNLHYPRIRCYWEPKLQIPMIVNSMPVNRFSKLRQNLHFVNIKQYVKNKPKPWGIKIFALCGSSGMLYDFIIYQGATTELEETESFIFGFGGSVVTALSKRITELNCQLYYDNYFSNYNVLQYLRGKHIYVSGTARIDRFQKPPFMSDTEMKKKGRGSCEDIISRDGEIIMTKWFDNKPVVMASNYMGIGEQDECRRWDKTRKEYIQVPRPDVIRNYNAHMGGVDKLDYLITIYRISVRTKKWTLKMFAHAIDLSCANAWLEYQKKAKALGVEKTKILDLLHFRAYVAEVLLKSMKTPTRKRGRPSSTAEAEPGPSTLKSRKGTMVEIRPVKEVRLDGFHHWPMHDQQKNASRCKFPGCKGKSRIRCAKCNIHLCCTKDKNCFVKYHT